MVNENDYEQEQMPYYQFQQPMQMPVYPHEMYHNRALYYEPNMYGNYMHPVNSGYMPPYVNGWNMPPYMNDATYGPQASPYMGEANIGPQANPYMGEADMGPQANPYYEDVSGGGAQANRIMQQFLDENGQVNIPKMLQTVGQFADTVQQVSPVIKQLNDLVRSFRA